MLEGNKISDITGELISNGMLPHKQDAPYYGQIVRAHFHVFVAFHNVRLGIPCHLAQVTGMSMTEQEAGFLLKGQCKYRRVVTSTC